MKTFSTTVQGQDLAVNDILKRWTIYNRTSSFIAYIATDGDSKLFIQFNNGNCVIFSGVPLQAIGAAVAAPSIGKFYHANLKDKFENEKVEDHCITVVTDAGDDDYLNI